MSNSLQRYKNFDLAFQIAFVSAIVSLIGVILLSIIAGLLPNHIFNTGALSILPVYSDGTINQSLVVGVLIVASFFVVFLLPAIFSRKGSLVWSRRFIYVYSGLLLIGVVIYVLVVPYAQSQVPAFETNYYIVVCTLSAISSFLICSQPVIAERADRKKNNMVKPEQE